MDRNNQRTATLSSAVTSFVGKLMMSYAFRCVWEHFVCASAFGRKRHRYMASNHSLRQMAFLLLLFFSLLLHVIFTPFFSHFYLYFTSCSFHLVFLSPSYCTPSPPLNAAEPCLDLFLSEDDRLFAWQLHSKISSSTKFLLSLYVGLLYHHGKG